MAESETPAAEIQINIKGPSELKLQINITTDKTVLELKQAIADKSDVPADRQRLIYSGRVLKDEDLLSVYKVQSAHTIHMVKGAVKSGGASSSTPGSGSTTSAGASAQQLPRMQTGQNPHDPLTQLNSHMGFGAMAGLNPFADMGVNPTDPNMMQTLMNSPQFMQQMSSMMSNPQILEQIIAMNPQMASMAPHIRETLQNEHFRNMISDPNRLREMLNMAQMMQSMSGGAGPFGGGPFGGGFGGAPSFPAPGTPNTLASTATSPSSGTTPSSPPSTTDSTSAAGAGAGAGLGGAGAGAPPFNPFFNPALMQQMFGGVGAGGAAGANPFGFGGFGTPPAPADTRPPEERFQVQLQQLQDMGFTNAQQNIRALLATGGNVHSAIEYILGGGGI